MKKILLASALIAGSLAGVAHAQDGALNGAAGGAVTGAIVGGPVGAAVGGVAGAIVGTAIDPPPQKVVTYVERAPARESVVIEQPVVVGKPIPTDVVLVPVDEDPRYAYTIINDQRVIVDPQTHTVVQVIE